MMIGMDGVILLSEYYFHITEQTPANSEINVSNEDMIIDRSALDE